MSRRYHRIIVILSQTKKMAEIRSMAYQNQDFLNPCQNMGLELACCARWFVNSLLKAGISYVGLTLP
jgi:hypothetical protein